MKCGLKCIQWRILPVTRRRDGRILLSVAVVIVLFLKSSRGPNYFEALAQNRTGACQLQYRSLNTAQWIVVDVDTGAGQPVNQQWITSTDDIYPPDHTRFVTERRVNNRPILILGLEVPTVKPIILSPPDTQVFDVAWSPDSKQIAFTAIPNRSGNKIADIFVVNADGTDLHKLTDSQAWSDAPTWSPDGKRLAFWSDRDLWNTLWTINANGSDLQNYKIFDGTGKTLPTYTTEEYSPYIWSPNGRYIAGRPFATLLSVTDTVTGSATVVANGTGSLTLFDVAWSPDSDWIAYLEGKPIEVGQSSKPPHLITRLKKVRRNGSSQVDLTPSNMSIHDFRWTATADRIAFVTDYTGQLYLINSHGSGLRLIDTVGKIITYKWLCEPILAF